MAAKQKMTPEEYRAHVDEISNQATHLLNTILSKIEDVLQPDRYLNLLNIMESFHWYSYVNALLILSQYPKAECLGSFDLWKKTAMASYNNPQYRILKKDYGKPVRLIAPFTVVKDNSRSLINFIVPVYDIQQTNDLPAPENDFVNLNRCSYTDMINALEFVAPYRKVFATYNDPIISMNVKGYCQHAKRQFVIDGQLSARGQLSTLLHEYATAELYLYEYEDEKLQGLVVESIYYILARHFRLNTDDITFSYISRFKESPAPSMAYALHIIQTLSHKIIEKIEEHLEVILELDPFPETTTDDANFFDDVDWLTEEGVIHET